MNLYVMPLGVEGSNVSLGSLDFLGETEAAVQYALSSESTGVATSEAVRVSGAGSRGAEQGVTARLPDLDLAIMNPPFTRSIGGNLMFGNLPSDQRERLKSELSRRLKSRQASATAGLGATFVAAAAPKLRPGEGCLALVLPATVCTGPSWAQTRALIEQDFELDVVISSHDSTRWNFSDSTDLSEALLIATRRPEDGKSQPHNTTFVKLWHNPDGVLDAHRLAQTITATTPAGIECSGTALLEVDSRHVGEVFSIPEASFKSKKWPGVQFARADLVRAALMLVEGREAWEVGAFPRIGVKIPMCKLEELGEIGPDVRDVRDGFEPTDSITAYPMVAGNRTEHREWLAASPDKHLAPLNQARPLRKLKRVDQLWPKAGRLLVAERLRLNTARVVAMCVGTPVLSNVWWPIKTPNQAWDKALAIYLNSSVGILSLLSTRNTTEGSWMRLKKADLSVMPVLDTRQLTPSQLQALSDLFDELAGEEFERLPAMQDCEARRAVDDGMSRILGLPDLGTLRTLLATEPVVSNRRL